MKNKFLLSFFLLLAANLGAQTWSDDVACIVYTHCSGCHSPGNIAPFPIMNYQEAFDKRFAIRGVVIDREMPPWKADPAFVQHAGSRQLTDDEIALIDAWVNADAPEGDPATAPDPPVFSGIEEIESPDLTVTIPPFTIPDPLTTDLYRVFAIPVSLAGNRYITGIEIIPGNRSVVHHVLAYQDTTGQALANDANDPGPGYTAFGGIGVFGAKLLGGWVPGSRPQFYPEGMGVWLPQNTAIVLQIHYPAGSGGQVDSTKINLRLAEGPMRQVYNSPILNHVTSLTDGPLVIPANQMKTFHAKYTSLQPASLLGISPHAHLICSSMKAFAVTVQGDTIPLVDIPEWDFHWQGQYVFQKLIKMPALTTVHGIATYDNTENNEDNPSSPPQTVSVGEATTDEMMIFYFTFLGYQPGDEDFVIDTSSHRPHYLDCETNTVLPAREADGQVLDFQLFPNPAGDYFTIEKSFPGAARLRLSDFSGRVVFEKMMENEREKVETHGLPPGIYSAALFLENGRLAGARKVVVQK